MRTSVRFVLFAVVCCMTAAASAADEKNWVSLFDGKSLDGWTVRGGFAEYKVEDGAIVGTTVDGSPNTFLCRGDYGDFELELEVLCDPKLNSGVQIRSHVYEKDTTPEGAKKAVRKAGTVYGYQCEISGKDDSSGNFWDEARRAKWLDDYSTKSEAQKAYKFGEWNKYRIVAQGDHIRSWVNGVPCADFRDDMDKSGFIGLQVHGIKKGEGPYQVRWRNIRIRELGPDAKVE
ncbi:MAG: 3-keto-disaccharide hydrolase [Planctomycetota bacterium]